MTNLAVAAGLVWVALLGTWVQAQKAKGCRGTLSNLSLLFVSLKVLFVSRERLGGQRWPWRRC